MLRKNGNDCRRNVLRKYEALSKVLGASISEGRMNPMPLAPTEYSGKTSAKMHFRKLPHETSAGRGLIDELIG